MQCAQTFAVYLVIDSHSFFTFSLVLTPLFGNQVYRNQLPNIMALNRDLFWLGDLIACTAVAPIVRKWRDMKIDDSTRSQLICNKLKPIFDEIKALHSDLLHPAWC